MRGRSALQLCALLGACSHPTVGRVLGSDGNPVAGALVHSERCDGVTADDGRFVLPCAATSGDLAISQPGFLSATVRLGGDVVPDLVLQKIPVEAGVYALVDDRLTEVPRVTVSRRPGEGGGSAWCVDADAVGLKASAGPLRLLDNHDVDWRLFSVPADGCPYRVQPGDGAYWTSPTPGIAVARGSEVAPGRSWVDVTLQPGRYVLLDWYVGAPVPAADDAAADTWLGRLITVR